MHLCVRKEKIMSQKVLLILADGFKPDMVVDSGNPYGKHLLELGSYSLEAKTVFPSVTLPCHMSLFHSVEPDRHGILTNTYVPQSRPVKGLCEQLSDAGKTCAFFYDWEELRDLSRPSSLTYSFFVSGEKNSYEKADEMVLHNALSYLSDEKPDFAFVYLGLTDAVGHSYGWMTDEYVKGCAASIERIRNLAECLKEEYHIIITADHGGHGRDHGTRMAEDMLIPVICIGEGFEPGRQLGDVSICDLAPTIVSMLGVSAFRDWEGKSLL